jgi:hypothetical protein
MSLSQFSLAGSVKNLATGTMMPVSSSSSMLVNGIEATSVTCDVFLRRTSAGFVLAMLGKCGEPIANQRLP